MGMLVGMLLTTPVGDALSQRYHLYRQHHTSRVNAVIGCAWLALMWALLPLENPGWRYIRSHFSRWYPQIYPHRPRPLDVVRIALQSVFLLVLRPRHAPAHSGRAWRARTVAWREQYYAMAPWVACPC